MLIVGTGLPSLICLGLLCSGTLASDTADRLRRLDLTVVQQRSQVEGMLSNSVYQRIRKANRGSTAEWRSISTREEWEIYRDLRIQRLRDSLGILPDSTASPIVHVTGELSGDGYRVENLVFESRTGIWVTANLYVPEPPRSSMPGILICHSHHNPKTQGELQDMGMTWARWGCLALVMDQPGHGERRDHPFHSEQDYAGAFRVGRQDYYFRYNLGIQLHLIGESLVGWMVWDLIQGVDLLLNRKGVDKERIILVGAVAGGGDPSAIAAALDERIAAAVPLNFGGPQGYHPYPLPEDADDSFNYAGSGSWESTRNLRLSCRDGFLPWVIVGGIAPRYLVYAHEFSWDRERDPVWKRLLDLYGEIYQVPDRLDYSHGFGTVRKRPPEASHCNNIGPVQRERIHQAFQRWFQIEGSLESEYSQRRDPEELLCLGPNWRNRLRPLHLYEKAEEIAESRLSKVRGELQDMLPQARLESLRMHWRSALGSIDPSDTIWVVEESTAVKDGIEVSRFLISGAAEASEDKILIPAVLLRLERSRRPNPVALCVAQSGKQKFLRERVEDVASLLDEGLAVCLLDVRGTGETAEEEGRGWRSRDTETSSSLLMLGETLVGERLFDLRTVIRFLQHRSDVDGARIVLWGDSLQQPNQSDKDLQVPMGIESEPAVSEPLGGLLGLLSLLFEPDLRGVYVHGGLVSFQSVLSGPFCYVPHDVVIPGVILTGDLPVLAEAVGSEKLLLEGMVDGLNRQVPKDTLYKEYESISSVAGALGSAERTAWILDRVR